MTISRVIETRQTNPRLQREREVGITETKEPLVTFQLAEVRSEQTRSVIAGPGVVESVEDYPHSAQITILQDVPNRRKDHGENLLLRDNMTSDKGTMFSISSCEGYERLEGPHLFVDPFIYDHGDTDYNGEPRLAGTVDTDDVPFDSTEFSLSHNTVYLGGLTNSNIQTVLPGSISDTPYLIELGGENTFVHYWSESGWRTELVPENFFPLTKDTQVIAGIDQQLIEKALEFVVYGQMPYSQEPNQSELESVSPSEINWKKFIALARNLPQHTWTVFERAKINSGLTRSWEGVKANSEDLTYKNMLIATNGGEVVIPTFTVGVDFEQWRFITENVANHISAISKLGKAILENQRHGNSSNILPSLESLGFSVDEIDILLSRPEISELFLLSRTDISCDFPPTGEIPRIWRYETNTSQPGGAEVVDYFASPDTETGKIPIPGQLAESVGLRNQTVLPAYIEAVRRFWHKYHKGDEIEGVLVLSGGYSLGTELLKNELTKSFDCPVMAEETVAPRPLDESREQIKAAAAKYGDLVSGKFSYNGKWLYYDNGQVKQKVSIILHEPRIDIEHIAALKNSPLIEAWKNGHVEIVNPPQARVCGAKSLEQVIRSSEAWSELERLGFGLTEDEKIAEIEMSIRTTQLNKESFFNIQNCSKDEWRRLVIKPAIAGSGRGIIMGRNFTEKEDFVTAVKQAWRGEEPYIVMEEIKPGTGLALIHTHGAPVMESPMDINPYAVIMPSENNQPSEVVVPAAISRAFLPLEPIEKELGEAQGIKLNVLGPDNYFILPNGTKRQYMIGIGTVMVY